MIPEPEDCKSNVFKKPTTFEKIYTDFLACRAQYRATLDALEKDVHCLAKAKSDAADLEVRKGQVEVKAKDALDAEWEADRKKKKPTDQEKYVAAWRAVQDSGIDREIEDNRKLQERLAQSINIGEWRFSGALAELKVYGGALEGAARLAE